MLVPLHAETVFLVGNFPVTNSILDMLFVDLVLVVAIIILRKNLSLIPNMFQNIVESLIKAFYDLTETVAEERAKKIFPFFFSFFTHSKLERTYPGILINWFF
jgi:F0F1-type ATP synthase membrane subunit a